MADQAEYEQGMDMVMRGGKGGPRTGVQTLPDPKMSPFASMLASRFGGFGGQ